MFVAALGAALADASPTDALAQALEQIPSASGAAQAVRLGADLAGNANGGAAIRSHYDGMSPVHTLNNLALVVWALFSHLDDFGAAIGDAVGAGLDTDCNGATVGGLWGIQGDAIPGPVDAAVAGPRGAVARRTRRSERWKRSSNAPRASQCASRQRKRLSGVRRLPAREADALHLFRTAGQR